MLSIRNLCGVWRTLPGTGGVRLTPVAREDLGARIRLEPAGERLGLSIGQEFYKPVPFEVHERGAVASALTMRAQSSTPRTRAGSGAGSGVRRIREIIVAGLGLTPMRFARRDPASPPSAKARARSSMVSLSVARAHGATILGRRSMKMRRAHEGPLQKNLRTRRMSLTG